MKKRKFRASSIRCFLIKFVDLICREFWPLSSRESGSTSRIVLWMKVILHKNSPTQTQTRIFSPELMEILNGNGLQTTTTTNLHQNKFKWVERGEYESNVHNQYNWTCQSKPKEGKQNILSRVYPSVPFPLLRKKEPKEIPTCQVC